MLSATHRFLPERLRCLLFDFLLILAALAPGTEAEVSSASSSSSLGAGHKSRRILGSGFTSTVTGVLGMSSNVEKSANSSAVPFRLLC